MKFPKRILVKIEQPGTADEFLGAETEANVHKMVAVGDQCTVGVYQLVGTKHIKGIVVETQRTK